MYAWIAVSFAALLMLLLVLDKTWLGRWFKESARARFGLRKIVAAIAAWAVVTFSTDVTWDGALLRGLIVAVGLAVVGLLDKNTEPFVGNRADAVEVPVPPAERDPGA